MLPDQGPERGGKPPGHRLFEREETMKIGDRVYVQGYVDEIRNETIIIRNKGGYFGTDASEVVTEDEKKVLTSEDLIKNMPMRINGFRLDELAVFAEACRNAGITDDEMHGFVVNAESAYEYIQKEIFKRFEKDLLRGLA